MGTGQREGEPPGRVCPAGALGERTRSAAEEKWPESVQWRVQVGRELESSLFRPTEANFQTRDASPPQGGTFMHEGLEKAERKGKKEAQQIS